MQFLYRPLPYEAPGSVMLSDLSPTTKERDVYAETIEADHEYEILDRYSQPQYDDVKVPPPKPEVQLQPSGDYEFTQCPAYVPMATVTTTTATTSDDKQETVPKTPSPAQDNQ